MLSVIGFILEFLCTRYGSLVLNATPFTYVSLLIVFVAIVRWKLWGLTIVPIVVFANFLAGQKVELPYLAAVYDWKFYLSAVIGIATIGINVLFFRKDTNKVINSVPSTIGVIAIDYVLINVVQLIVYRLLTSGNIFEVGENMVKYSADKMVNACQYGESGFAYNLFGLGVLIVGIFILRSQGIVCDRTQKFIDDKRNAELDRIDAVSFTIQEAEEDEASGEADSDTDK
ncbi:MAG: hypothetical protein ACI35S_05790 [Anaeroplasma sp.]